MTRDAHTSAIAARQETWNREITDQLPRLLDRLLASPVYGLTRNRPLPPKQHGVYAFIDDDGAPQYVGRVGLTERSRLAGRPFSSFQTRVRGHATAHHNSGTYAYSRTCALYRSQRRTLASTRQGNCDDLEFMAEFRRQCAIVRDMGLLVVEIDDSRLAAVFEIYAATVLGLPQSFAVS